MPRSLTAAISRLENDFKLNVTDQEIVKNLLLKDAHLFPQMDASSSKSLGTINESFIIFHFKDKLFQCVP